MKKIKASHGIKSLVMACMLSTSVVIGQTDGDTVLKVLVRKGVITQEEANAIQAEAAAKKSAASVTNAPITPGAPATGQTLATGPTLDAAEQKTLSNYINQTLKDKWYEKLSIRGYTQVRFHEIVRNDEEVGLNVPSDRSVSEDQTFFIRRGRLVVSGDATEHLFVYAQADFNGSLGGDTDFGLQMRDYYADIAIDKNKEYRFRIGQSKVPFGWVNMQSSQNRIPLERPDGINSAAEGERDIGAFFYWAPKEIRARYRDLVKLGLKGSGDYGVAGVGAYSGQGPNRSDRNGEPHVVGRLNYPWKLKNGQYVEAGVQGYYGRFVSSTSGGVTIPDKGVTDERVGANFII